MNGEPTPTHIYISGPMRGIDGFNFPAFFEAERLLRQHFPDADICNPAREDCIRFRMQKCLSKDPTGLIAGRYLQHNPDHPFTEDDLRAALRTDLTYITTHCNLVVLLAGWENSKGARAEAATAEALGIPVVLAEGLGEVTVDGSTGDPVVVAPAPVSVALTVDNTSGLGTYNVGGEGEVRLVSATGGEKGSKLAAFDQISPVIEWELAEHFGKGARKYAAHNFRNGYAWSLSYSALRRHLAEFWSGKEWDVCPADHHGCRYEEGVTYAETEHGETCYNHTGSRVIVAVIWHAMVLAEFSRFAKFKEYDDRYVYEAE